MPKYYQFKVAGYYLYFTRDTDVYKRTLSGNVS